MAGNNDDFQELAQAIQIFCGKERSACTGNPLDHAAASELRIVFTRVLFGLSAKFPDAPNVVYARGIVIFAIDSLDHRVNTVLWQKYFSRGLTLEEIADELNYSPRTVRRFINTFPEQVARQLWECGYEIPPPPPLSLTTLHHRARMILEDEFDLTETQAKTLLAFCYSRSLGLSRGEISKKVLNRSLNTIKAHFKHIMQRLRVKKTSEAVDKALDVLKRHFGNDFDKCMSVLTLEQLQSLYLDKVPNDKQ